ncbi:MAG: type II toxin-antitoxin system RelE/ParE family toxin [Candidatus Omnitrophica bacterium]|nr:type II toxin-antitoxin system RelE/ParE family toxin [Candidatus Omnitrophota bacterium]
MELHFKHNKLAKILNSERETIKEFGEHNGKKIMQRLAELEAADNLEQKSYLPTPARHELKGNRKGQFAVWIKQPWRIVFEPNHDPLPLCDDGGIGLSKVTKILIIGVEDYH